MSKIKRWDVYADDDGIVLYVRQDGDYVKYADHAAEVARLQSHHACEVSDLNEYIAELEGRLSSVRSMHKCMVEKNAQLEKLAVDMEKALVRISTEIKFMSDKHDEELKIADSAREAWHNRNKE